MMQIVKYRYFIFIVHALGWSMVLLFPYFISSADNQYAIGPIPGFFFTLSGIIHMIIFYTNTFFLYPKFLNKNYWWLYIISSVLLIFVSVKIKFYLLETFFPGASPDARTHVVLPSIIVFIISIVYGILSEKIRAEKWQKENEAIRLAMEVKLLRSQISPHFLFNVLTNLVSLARKKSDHLESSLLMLSGLMRYMLYDAGKKISLQQEVEYLESYVTLQKLRFGRDVKIGFAIDVPSEESNQLIEPMLLVPFVENAFKHGTGFEDQPFIQINMAVHSGILTFAVRNKFEENTSKDESSGIGLSNVRSRLALLYPERHVLVIHTDQDLFSIHLTLKLL